MSVLSVADATASGQKAGAPTQTNKQRSSADRKTVDIATRLTEGLEEFLSGFIPGQFRVKLDWGTLAPLLTTVSATVSAAIALRGYT